METLARVGTQGSLIQVELEVVVNSKAPGISLSDLARLIASQIRCHPTSASIGIIKQELSIVFPYGTWGCGMIKKWLLFVLVSLSYICSSALQKASKTPDMRSHNSWFHERVPAARD
jgi:hypothetical protein